MANDNPRSFRRGAIVQPACAAFLIAMLAIVLPGIANAQPMVEQVPSDAIIYVGWTSGQGLKEDYANSHLKKLIDASNIKQTIETFLPAIIQKLASAGPNANPPAVQVSRILAILLQHPTALYYEGLDLSVPHAPLRKIGIACDAAQDAARLADDLSALAKSFPIPSTVQVRNVGGLVTLRISRPTTQPSTRSAANIRFHKRFAAALAQVDSDPITIFYVDTPRLIQSIDQAIQHGRNAELKSRWSRFIEIAGLNSLGPAIWTGDFQGPNWDSRSFIAAPAPRKGLINLLAGAPLSDNILKAVPQSIALVAARSFDPAAAYDELRAAMDQIDPTLESRMDQAIADMRADTGVDLKADLLDALGSDWATYLDPNIGGTSFLGTVWVNQLRNAADAQAALTKLESWFNDWIAGKLNDSRVRIEFKQADLHGLRVHYLAAPIVSPAWAISDGRLYFSLYPEITAAAVRAASGKGSILDNVPFISMRTRLVPAAGEITGIGYADLSQFATANYGSWLMLTRASGLADLFGMTSPLQILPPLATIMNELSPAASITWTDNAGFHCRRISPFPGSGLLLINPAGIYQRLLPMTFIRRAMGR